MAKLEMKRGDDRTLRVMVKDRWGGPFPWAGTSIWFTAKRSLSAPDSLAAIFKSSETTPVSDFDMTTDGVALASINKEDTTSLPNRTETYFYDVQVKRADGKIETVDEGTITITAEVTHAT